jgi:hypothetical protein
LAGCRDCQPHPEGEQQGPDEKLFPHHLLKDTKAPKNSFLLL